MRNEKRTPTPTLYIRYLLCVWVYGDSYTPIHLVARIPGVH